MRTNEDKKIQSIIALTNENKNRLCLFIWTTQRPHAIFIIERFMESLIVLLSLHSDEEQTAGNVSFRWTTLLRKLWETPIFRLTQDLEGIPLLLKTLNFYQNTNSLTMEPIIFNIAVFIEDKIMGVIVKLFFIQEK